MHLMLILNKVVCYIKKALPDGIAVEALLPQRDKTEGKVCVLIIEVFESK